MTFSVDIEIVNAYDHNGNCIVHDEQKEEKMEVFALPKSQYYEWRMNPKKEIGTRSLSRPMPSKTFKLFGINQLWVTIARYSITLEIYLKITIHEITITCLTNISVQSAIFPFRVLCLWTIQLI